MTEVIRAAAGKARRQARIVELIERHPVHSQTELADLLADDGLAVTQGTLSKDLVEVGAVRARDAGGALVYTVGPTSAPLEQAQLDARVARLCNEVMVGADSSANLAVLRTPPGAASYFASAIDRAGWPTIVGTIAGDDTVMIICRAADGGAAMAATFDEMSRTARPPSPTTA